MEIDPVRLHNERAGQPSDPAGPLRREQEDMTIRMFDALTNSEVVFVGQAPPAFGKTVVIRAVTLGLLEAGKTVLVSEPTYSRLDQLREYFVGVGIEPTILKGRSKLLEDGLECPVISDRPNYFWCREQHDLEKRKGEGCKAYSCEIKRQETLIKEAKVAITVHASVVRHDDWLDSFSVAIFDESHTLPGILEEARVKRIDSPHLSALAQHFRDFVELDRAVKTLIKLERTPRPRDIGPNIVDNMFGGSVRKVVRSLHERVRREARHVDLPAVVGSAIHQLEGLAGAVEQSGKYRFTAYGGAVYAAPPSRALSFRSSSRTGGTGASVALVSATIENPKFHVNDSGFGNLGLVAPYEYPHDPLVERSERRIFSLVDGPILRVTGEESDLEARQIANEIISDVLLRFKFRTLILCRSERDKRAIYGALKKDPVLEPRILEIDDAKFEDADHLERYVRERMKQGQDLVLATASSKLWEGANLDIQLLVIDSLPYTAPDPWNNRRETWLNSKPFRTMLRRFQQGIGRLIRAENQVGVAVVVDGRLQAQWKMMKRQLPDYVRNDVHATRRSRLLTDIEVFMRDAQERVAQGRIRAGQHRQTRLPDVVGPGSLDV
jgi:Rad3-related DNA helicase